MNELTADSRRMTASALRQSSSRAFLLNPPFSLRFDQPNNATMQRLTIEERNLDLAKALEQFHSFYAFLTKHSLAFLLPSISGLQDQTYVSNVGAYLPHCEDETIVLSNFRSQPRIGEEIPAGTFFQMMGYDVYSPPTFFEGEADLKHLHGNIYLGAHGMRTSCAALEWLEQAFAMTVIPIRISDPNCYHLDCIVFPLDEHHTLVCTELVDAERLKEIERHTAIIDISYEEALATATNCLRLGDHLLAQSNAHLFASHEDMYRYEKAKIAKLERIAARHSLELELFDLSEFRKSGAALSCLAMRLN